MLIRMSDAAQTLSLLGVIFLWLAALALFRRYRRTTPGYPDRITYKSRLPKSIGRAERIVALPILVAGMLAFIILLMNLHHRWHAQGPDHPGTLGAGLIGLSSIVAMIAPAFFVSNVVSWLTPSLRRANEAAMEGLPTMSYRRANIGLAIVGGLIFLIFAAQGLLGALEPWAP
jgi:hypothetical protein